MVSIKSLRQRRLSVGEGGDSPDMLDEGHQRLDPLAVEGANLV